MHDVTCIAGAIVIAGADPATWWRALEAALGELRSGRGGLEQVRVLALTGQMHTAVLLDAAGDVVPPTILWLDRRATAETAELQARLGMPSYHLNSTYTLPKLYWLARHRPEVLRRTAHILWPKDYLRYRLTGVPLTDYTEAGGAALLDWATLTGAEARLESIGIDPGILPPLRWPQEDVGRLLPQWATAFGLRPDLKVIPGAGDMLALIAGAPPAMGQVTCCLGASSTIFSPLAPDQQVDEARGRIYACPLLAYPLLGGVSSTTGAALQWAWQAFYAGQIPFDEAVRQAVEVPAGAEGLMFLPFLSGERNPFWNDALRGAFYGLTLAHRRPHMLRAVLEGVAFSLRYLLDDYAEVGVDLHTIALAGGGAMLAGWPQRIADICRLPVHVYAAEETVTRALYADACLALEPGSSCEQALARTFAAPEVFAVQAPDDTDSSHYRRYCRLAEFADQSLCT